MKKTVLYTGMIAFIALQGCGNEKKTNTDSIESPIEQTTVNTNVVSPDSNQVPSAPAEQAVSPAEQVPAPAVSSTATGPNPAHGQPGHRCDIEVGAPLNSPPGKNAAPAPTTITADPGKPAPTMQVVQPQSAPAAAPAAKVPTAPGMNPPHGEPGHDCAIAVGAPLKK